MRELFERQASKAGAKVYTAGDWSAAVRAVTKILAEAGVKTAAVASDLGAVGQEIAAALREQGVALIDVDGPRAAAQADAGLSRAALGIAETGSVAVVGNDLNDRLVTMLVAIHVALLPARLLVPSLDEAAPFLREQVAGGAHYLSFVTGPSRTADIERVLTIGVQGPRELHVVLVMRDE